MMKVSGQDADKDQLTRIHRMLEAEERRRTKRRAKS